VLEQVDVLYDHEDQIMCSDLVEFAIDKLMLVSLDASGLILVRNISKDPEEILQRIQLNDLNIPQNIMDPEVVKLQKLQFVSMHCSNPFKLVWVRDVVKDGPKLLMIDTESSKLTGFYGEDAKPRFEKELKLPPMLQFKRSLVLDALSSSMVLWTNYFK